MLQTDTKQSTELMKGSSVGLLDGAVNQISGVNKGWQKTSAKNTVRDDISAFCTKKHLFLPPTEKPKNGKKSTNCFIHHDIYMGPK